jgi:hypothetical protein
MLIMCNVDEKPIILKFEDGICEKRTLNSYTRIDCNHYQRVYLYRHQHGIKSKYDFSGPGSETRTYNNIPPYKIFDFLRKAFEESPWNKIKKFKFVGKDTEYYVNTLYWDHDGDGYVLRLNFFKLIDIGTGYKHQNEIITVKDVNCITPVKNIIDMNQIIILEEKR